VVSILTVPLLLMFIRLKDGLFKIITGAISSPQYMVLNNMMVVKDGLGGMEAVLFFLRAIWVQQSQPVLRYHK
jgi:hypothetical protein